MCLCVVVMEINILYVPLCVNSFLHVGKVNEQHMGQFVHSVCRSSPLNSYICSHHLQPPVQVSWASADTVARVYAIFDVRGGQ